VANSSATASLLGAAGGAVGPAAQAPSGTDVTEVADDGRGGVDEVLRDHDASTTAPPR
jgi:hypothetical protein